MKFIFPIVLSKAGKNNEKKFDSKNENKQSKSLPVKSHKNR